MNAAPIVSNEAATSGTEIVESGLPRPIPGGRAIVNFERRVTPSEREALLRRGIEVGGYLGGTAYTVRLGQGDLGTLFGISKDINPVQHVLPLDARSAHIKIDPALSGALRPTDGQATVPSSLPKILVQAWPETDIEQLKQQLQANGSVLQVSASTRKIEMSVESAENVRAISLIEGVKYIAPSFSIKPQNTHIRRNVGADVAAGPPHLLSGKGVRIGVWDAGHVAASHPSFTGRLEFVLELDGFAAPRTHLHATHVAGIIAGSGEYSAPVAAGEDARAMEIQFPAFGKAQTPAQSSDATTVAHPAAGLTASGAAEPSYPGVAIDATLVSFEFNQATEKLINLLRKAPTAIDVVNNSWNIELTPAHCHQLASHGPLGGAEFDAVTSGFMDGQPIRRIPIVISAGNNRDDGTCGLSIAPGFPNYRTVAPPATAKNVIAVGAIDADTNEMTTFSGWGPTKNGRLKPDVTAPGCRGLGDGARGIVSMVPTTGVGRYCGTSMAAPAVTGAIALMIEKMGKLGVDKLDVLPSTYKALLIQGAEDLGQPGPDFQFGYGRVDIVSTLKLMDENAYRQGKIEQEGEFQIQEISVGSGLNELKVTLAWDDRPLGVFANEELSSDLDLVVLSPTGAPHLPFLLNAVAGKEREPAQTGVDHVNVVEQVLVRQPEAGVWRISVRASKIGSPVDGQTYSLVMSAR
jgi:subtilisin family serine protease